MIKRIKNMKQDEVRLIKISREALFEFIYEKFIESQDDYLGVKATDVSDFFEIDFPDTASSMFQIEPRYRAYTIKELTELSKK